MVHRHAAPCCLRHQEGSCGRQVRALACRLAERSDQLVPTRIISLRRITSLGRTRKRLLHSYRQPGGHALQACMRLPTAASVFWYSRSTYNSAQEAPAHNPHRSPLAPAQRAKMQCSATLTGLAPLCSRVARRQPAAAPSRAMLPAARWGFAACLLWQRASLAVALWPLRR